MAVIKIYDTWSDFIEELNDTLWASEDFDHCDLEGVMVYHVGTLHATSSERIAESLIDNASKTSGVRALTQEECAAVGVRFPANVAGLHN